MEARLDPWKVAPELMHAVLGMEKAAQASGLEKSLYELVKTRASQINGCAFCVHMHTRDAMNEGEKPARLFLLDAWRDSSLYTDRERAALAWTEVLTQVSLHKEDGAVDRAYEELEKHFSEKERAALTLAVSTINVWNRFSIGFRTQHPTD